MQVAGLLTCDAGAEPRSIKVNIDCGCCKGLGASVVLKPLVPCANMGGRLRAAAWCGRLCKCACYDSAFLWRQLCQSSTAVAPVHNTLK